MFNQLKQIRDLKNQAKSLQEILANENAEVDYEGIKVVINGNQKIVALTLPDTLSKSELETKIPPAIDLALKKIQRIIVEKVQGSGLNLPKF